MRKWLRLGLCLGLLTVALTCSALAATDEYTEDVAGKVDYAGGKYTASYTGVTSGEEYALLVVKGTPGDYKINEESIMYIDQKAAASGTISFEFIPRSTPDCVVLLGGKFSDKQSPKVLGTLTGKGVTVSGQVSLGDTRAEGTLGGVTVSLTDAGGQVYSAQTASNGSYTIESVSEGIYTLKVEMKGFLMYTKNKVEITSEQSQLAVVKLAGGDINSSGLIDGEDLSLFLGDFGSKASDTDTAGYSDINGTGLVDGLDLSIFLANFGEKNTVE